MIIKKVIILIACIFIVQFILIGCKGLQSISQDMVTEDNISDNKSLNNNDEDSNNLDNKTHEQALSGQENSYIYSVPKLTDDG